MPRSKKDCVNQVVKLQDKLIVKQSESALEARKNAEEEIRRLHTDLEHAEEREDGLLMQVQTLEQTVQELSSALDEMQNDEPRQVLKLQLNSKF